MYSSYLLYFMYTLYLLIAGKPPPGGFSYLAGSLPKNPEKKNPPRSKLYKSFGGDPLPPGSWLGNLPNETSPEGGVSRDQYSRCILFHIYYVYILSYKLYFVYVSTHVASLHGVRGSISNLLVCTFQSYPTSYIPYTYSLLLIYTCSSHAFALCRSLSFCLSLSLANTRCRSLSLAVTLSYQQTSLASTDLEDLFPEHLPRLSVRSLSLALSLSRAFPLSVSFSLSLSLCLFLCLFLSISFPLSLVSVSPSLFSLFLYFFLSLSLFRSFALSCCLLLSLTISLCNSLFISHILFSSPIFFLSLILSLSCVPSLFHVSFLSHTHTSAHTHNSTNILWSPQLFENPRYTEEVKSWGLAANDGFFACAMSFLLRPTFLLRHALAPLLNQVRFVCVYGCVCDESLHKKIVIVTILLLIILCCVLAPLLQHVHPVCVCRAYCVGLFCNRYTELCYFTTVLFYYGTMSFYYGCHFTTACVSSASCTGSVAVVFVSG